MSTLRVGSVSATATLSVAGGAPLGAGAELLPEPGVFPAGDETAILYALQARLQLQDVASAQSEIDGQAKFERVHRDEERAAMERAREAEQSHGFFGSLGDLVKDVASDVRHGRFADAASDAGHDFGKAIADPKFLGTLGTIGEWAFLVGGVGIGGVVCAAGFGSKNVGAGLLGAAGVALSIAGFVVSKTKCFGDKSSAWIGMGLSVSGGLCAFGGAEALGGAGKLGTAAKVGFALSAAATVVGGASQAAKGAGEIPRAVYDHEAEVAGADADEAQHLAQHAQRRMKAISDFLEDVNASHRRAMEALQGAQQAYHDASSAMIRYI